MYGKNHTGSVLLIFVKTCWLAIDFLIPVVSKPNILGKIFI
jgi:hypothetical protein